MSKNQFEPNIDDGGTYQTGVTHQNGKSASGLIAVLLVLTIFLGGLASTLGILNFRLVQKLMEPPEPTVPMNIQTPSSNLPSDPGTSIANGDPEPELPESAPAPLQPESYPGNQKDLSVPDVFLRNNPSLVHIQCEDSQDSVGGTGVVLNSEGYILTNHHLVMASSRIYVQLHDGTVHRATLVGSDILTDLAVLYIDARDLQPASFADTKSLYADDPIIITIGELALGQDSLRSGTVLQPHKTLRLGEHRLAVIQTSIGSCDGPVFNRYGQVIGMNSSLVPKYFNLYIQTNVGYAVPGGILCDTVNQILATGTVAGRPTLGLRTEAITKVYQQYWNLPGGLRLVEVSAEAARQGLRTGDILLALNGERLKTDLELYRLLLETPIGTTLTAVIFRDGQSITLPLTVMDTGA